MRLLLRTSIVVMLLAVALSGNFAEQWTQASAALVAPTNGTDFVYLPNTPNYVTRDVAQAFTSEQSGVLASGGGHVLSVGPNSVPTYSDGSPATIALSIDVEATPPVPPPDWMNIVSPPVIFGPGDFTFDFPLTVRMPVAGITDVSELFFLRYGSSGAWTRSLYTFDPENPTAVETTLFSLGPMAVGEYDVASADLRPQGGIYVPTTNCPIGGMNCFYYLTIQNFTPKYPDEVPVGALNGTTMRLRANPTAESPEPTLFMLPQGSYTFCYSALESPLTLSNLKKYINPNAQIVTVDEPYACAFTRTCPVEVRPINQPGWIEAVDNRPCQMGAGSEPDDPARLGLTGEFQITLRWQNNDSRATDVDLHLYGPNIHVWYSSKVSADGSLRLDRDWQSELGDAVENIYQVKDSEGKSLPMTPGSYRIEVVHYSGSDNMPYEVRVIRGGSVSNFSGTLSSGQTETLMTFTVP